MLSTINYDKVCWAALDRRNCCSAFDATAEASEHALENLKYIVGVELENSEFGGFPASAPHVIVVWDAKSQCRLFEYR
jgi:hypothetical protein